MIALDELFEPMFSDIEEESKKTCPKCGEEKFMSEFAKLSSSIDGRQYYCKSCMNAYHAKDRTTARKSLASQFRNEEECKKTLSELYHDEGLKCREIAKMHGVHTNTIQKALKRLGIARRPPGGANNCKGNPKTDYTVNGFRGNMTEVARHFGIPQSTLHDRLRKNGMSIERAVNLTLRRNG